MKNKQIIMGLYVAVYQLDVRIKKYRRVTRQQVKAAV